MLQMTVIIVSWNVKDDLYACLKSLEENGGPAVHKVIVVDNASSDGTPQMVRHRWPQVELIQLEKNVGFGRANNLGLQRVTTPLVLLLNPDTIVPKGTLAALIDALLADKRYAAAGPALTDSSGHIYPSCRRFPTMTVALHQFTILKSLRIFKKCHDYYIMKDFDHRSTRTVEQIMGAAMLFRTDVLKSVGGFDEQFFMYYEEVELCHRIIAAGYSIVFYPLCTIVHHEDHSTAQWADRMLFEKIKSLFIYFSKTEPKWKIILFRPLFIILFLLKLLSQWVEYSTKALLQKVTTRFSKKESHSRRNYSEKARQITAFLKKYGLLLGVIAFRGK